DKGALAFLAVTFGILAGLGLALQAVFAFQDVRRERERAVQDASLACLARNIYFEARGEPVAGQFAGAEGTMNRQASRLFPRSVCEVVYQKTWDPIRKRHVAAFSWTEFNKLPEPIGED